MNSLVRPSPLPEAVAARPATGPQVSLRAKLLLMVGLAVLVQLLLQGWSIYRERSLLLDSKRTELLSLAHSARGIAARFHADAKAGKLPEAEAKALAANALRAMRFGPENDYVLAFDRKGQYYAHGGNPALEGTDPATNKVGAATMVEFAARTGEALRRQEGPHFTEVLVPRPGQQQPAQKLSVFVDFPGWDWIISTGSYLDDIDRAVRNSLTTLGVLLAAAIASLLAAGLLITRNVLRQVGGEPSRVIAVMTRAARGDLTQRFPDAPPGSILASFGDTSDAVRGVIAQVRAEAASMKRDAQLIAESVKQVSEAAQAQSNATTSVAAAVEELTVSVSHISDAAGDTERNSEGVASHCRASQDDVVRSTEGMQRIAGAVQAASEQIGGLAARTTQISVIAASIKDIAAQTNLLALNAAIEAARAGEQGRGFSVVADEVRKLAERTSLATVEIDDTVGAVQREASESSHTMAGILPLVADGREATDQVAQALATIRESAETSLDRVRDVAHATREQSSASTAIAQQVEGIAQMVEETTAAMGETARSADDLRAMAERLDGLVARFQV